MKKTRLNLYLTNLKNRLNKQNKQEEEQEKAQTRKRTRKTDLTFIKKTGGRMQVKTKKGKKWICLCSCDISQQEEINRRYKELKKDKTPLDEIQKIFKQDYNLKKIRGTHQHQFLICNTGAIYKDGAFQKVDKGLYKMIEERL